MDKIIATKLAQQKLDEIVQGGDRQRQLNLLKESEYSVISHEGVDYQLRVTAFLQTKNTKSYA